MHRVADQQGGDGGSRHGPRTARASRRPAWLLGAALLTALAAAPQAQATSPGLNGRIAFYSERDDINGDIWSMNPDGSDQTRLTTDSGSGYQPAWSPDGTRIAFITNRDGNAEIYVMSSDSSNQVRLTNSPGDDLEPTWSPDGARIAFQSVRDGNIEIYVMNADGSDQTRLTNEPSGDGDPAWSPDGSRIAFTSSRDAAGNEIYLMNPDGGGVTRLNNDSFGDNDPTWSPNGARIAFATNGRYANTSSEIAAMNADGSNITRVTSTGTPTTGNIFPSWSPDGTKIAYTYDNGPNRDIYSANVDGSGETRLTNASADDGQPDWQPIPSADLSLAKTGSPETVPSGQDITYTLLARNDGPSRAFGDVTVTDPLPAGTTLVSANATRGSCSGTDTVVCNFGPLDPNTTGQATIVVRTGAAGTLTNTATVASATGDPNAANNSATATTQVLDDDAPVQTLRLVNTTLKKILDTGRLPVKVGVDEASKVKLAAKTREAKSRKAVPLRRVRIARGKVSFSAAGKRSAKLKLTKTGERALRGLSKARITVTARARDAAANTNTRRATKTIKRNG